MNLEMHRWTDISSRYTDCVILGNGASISIASTLCYPSLFEAAIGHGHLNTAQRAVFDLFKTHDFEFVMRALSHAHAINHHLGIEESTTAQAYKEVKNALIKTVKDVHPSYAEVESRLQAVAGFLSNFETVFSLNYDLVVYWALMAANELAGGYQFKDCFVNGQFEHDYKPLRAPHGNQASSTLVFYPHGNLALATDLYGVETKLKSRCTNLISEITEIWKMGGRNPLFVSEGDSSKKLLAIGRSSYLQAVYSELCANRNSVLIYGWGCGGQDSHILKALGRAGVTSLGISVHRSSESDPEHFCYVVSRAIRKTQGLEKATIQFFDSSDPGVWIHRSS